MRGKITSMVALLLPVAITVAISYYLQFTFLANREALTEWLNGFGPFLIVVCILLQAIVTILAPLGGFFIVIAMIALFGPGIALILVYLVSTPCYMINFWLARRFGRPLVKRVLGETFISKMDQFVRDEGLMALILTRLFQGGYFDYLSYAWGLTKIPFKSFAIVNIIFGIPATAIVYFAFREFDNLTYGLIAFYVITTILTGLSLLLSRTLLKSKELV